MKLVLVTLLALLLPMFWVVAAKAAPLNHQYAWSQTSDASLLSSQQQQALRLRNEINSRISQMYDSYRLLGDGQVHSPTARGLLSAAEAVQSASNQTTDFYSLEVYSQQVQSLQSALQVVRQLSL